MFVRPKNVQTKVGLTGKLDWYPPQTISSPTPHFGRVIIVGNFWNHQFKKIWDF